MPGDEAIPYAMRPGASLLRLRQQHGLFANCRPAILFQELIGASTLKPEVIEGLNLVILRELTGDVYFGEPRGEIRNAAGEREAFNTMRYIESEVECIAHVALQAARTRQRRLCSVDKANVLETMQLWREGLYEPVHGTAPDIAGKGVANPLASIPRRSPCCCAIRSTCRRRPAGPNGRCARRLSDRRSHRRACRTSPTGPCAAGRSGRACGGAMMRVLWSACPCLNCSPCRPTSRRRTLCPRWPRRCPNIPMRLIRNR